MDAVIVPLTRGQFALVDADQVEVLGLLWYAGDHGGRFYAQRTERKNGRTKIVRMHRLIMNAPDGVEVDHINGNPLDNRKCNLRLASHAENSANGPLDQKNKTGFKGVSFHKSRKKYRASINIRGKHKHLGLFHSPAEAAKVYDEVAAREFGEFALTNKGMGLL